MDPASDLVYLKKLLTGARIHYENPHGEATKLKVLWTHDKTPDGGKEADASQNFLEEAVELMKGPGESPEKALATATKGLRANPRSHRLYALRGEIHAGKGDWRRAIKWYETARRMAKLDKTCGVETTAGRYEEELRKSYRGRGEWHEENGRLIEAVADYEQVLVLRPGPNRVFELQDMLLRCLRKLDKYDAYRSAWSEFAKGAKPRRTADLMTQHAEFKIHARDVAAARRMLREAVTLDERNTDARDLLRVIFDTGHTMLAHAITWCTNGCYDKALMTIDKGTDCDPRNPGLTVLKTIVLRLSGRLEEAMRWLEIANEAFHKLPQSSTPNKRGSVVGNLTVDRTRGMLTDQWYLIRYDTAVEHMLNGRYDSALEVLRDEKLLRKSGEPKLSMGDCFMHQGKLGPALRSYVDAHEASVTTGCWQRSEKKHLIAQRVTEILNGRARREIQTKRSEKTLRSAERSLNVLRRGKIPPTRPRYQRGEALAYVARSRYRASPIPHPSSACLDALTDSLSFARGADDGGTRDAVTSENANLRGTIGGHESRKKFPYRTAILMQN